MITLSEPKTNEFEITSDSVKELESFRKIMGRVQKGEAYISSYEIKDDNPDIIKLDVDVKFIKLKE